MAIINYKITDTWQAISAAGESGSCWMVEGKDLDGRKDQADVFIYHSTTPPTGDNKLTESKRLFTPNNNTDVMIIPADNALDIYYARCLTTGSEALINVDLV